MSTLKLAKSITVLEDGKLSIFLFDNKEVYLQPTIIVDTLDSLQRLKIRDSVNYVDIDTSIEEIGGSPFGGTFPQLETAIRELAKSANSINYSGGGGGGGGDATAANQTTQITEAQTANTNLSNLLAELQLKADLTETQPVSLASLPLATNASTEAKQDNIVTQLTGVQRTPTLTRVTDATGSPIVAGAVEVSVYNAGNSNGVLLGAIIKKGETITFKVNNQKDTLGAISYDGTGTELVIQTLV
jgi:hypothetical protein